MFSIELNLAFSITKPERNFQDGKYIVCMLIVCACVCVGGGGEYLKTHFFLSNKRYLRTKTMI